MSVRAWRAISYGVPLAFLSLFFLYPLAAIVERGLRGAGDPPVDVLTDPLTREVVWFTVWQAFASTVLTILVAFPAAYVLGRYRFRGRNLVGALVVVPFVLPTVVVALAFLAILPDGIERGWVPILIAHAFFNVAVVVRIVGTFWANLDPRVSEAAATLGAVSVRPAPRDHRAAARTRARRGRSDRLPLLVHLVRHRPHPRRPAVRDDRGRDLQPGGPPVRPAGSGRPLDRAARVRRRDRVGRDAARTATGGTRSAARRAGHAPAGAHARATELDRRASLGGLAVFLGLPLAVLVERSLAVGGGHTARCLQSARRPTSVLLVAPWEAVVNSIVYASVATAIALVVGGLAAFAVADTRGSRFLDGLILLPLGASAVMLGLGFLIAFDTSPLDFRAAPWIVPVVQALVAIPFVVRIVAPTLRSIDPRQREAAALLGASPGRVRREVDLPIVSRGLAVAAGFAFAISLGEFGATVFLARPDRPTLPVAIFRFLGRPGELNVAQAYALAVVLMAVTVAAVLLVDRIRVRRGGWF